MSFVKFTPRYLIFFEAIVNGIVFLYFLSVCSLLVYRKATDFCKMIFVSCYIAEVIVSSSFLVEFFGSLRYRNMSSADRDIFSVSLSICIPFNSSCLIALAGNSRTMLNGSGGSGHHCPVPEFRGMVSVFPH
jgi:hypothetical protein